MSKSRVFSEGLIFVVVVLLAMGIIAIYSTTYSAASNSILNKQLFWVGSGIGLVLLEVWIPMKYLSKASKWILLSVFLVLLYLALGNVIFQIGQKFLHRDIVRPLPFVVLRNGAMRWLSVGSITIQPAEFAKFALILFLANYYGVRDTQTIESWKHGWAMPGLVVVLVLGVIMGGRSMSNAVISCAVSLLIMFYAGVKLRFLALSVFLLLIAGSLLILVTPFRRQRILNYVLKDKEAIVLGAERKKTDNYQLNRSVCAIGSGGGTGLGIGKGRLKHKLIPESKTDFIFAVIGEEMGFVGIGVCIVFYLLIYVCCICIAGQCYDRRGALICLAVGVFIPLQALLNLGVVCGLFPTTGVTAPLVSYGGSSILSVMMCLGLVLNVSRQNMLDSLKEAEELPGGTMVTTLPPLERAPRKIKEAEGENRAEKIEEEGKR